MAADGTVLAEARSPAGMGTLTPAGFEPALLDLVGPWLRDGRCIPAVACGMVGARQGWIDAGYRAVPCTPLAGGGVTAPVRDPRIAVRIVPGLSQSSPADVMRGEETQVAGFLSLNPSYDGVICLPGSHTKWIHASAGEIVGFRTAMTGEVFAALAAHSVLRHSLGPANTPDDTAGDTPDDDAFRAALDDAIAMPQGLALRLFQIRAEGLLGDLPPAAARARLSGDLIGAELAATRAWWLGRAVALIGAPALCRLYDIALAAQGLTPIRTKGDAMTLAGLRAAYDDGLAA